VSNLNVATAGTADTLTTTRTLWGQNFNGSTNVTGNLTSVGNITGTGAVTLTATGGTLALAATGANIVTASTNGTERVRVTGAGDVGIGTTTPGYKLEVNGSFAATTKSFVIDHPTKEGMKLRYGSLESPYHGVRLTGESAIVDKDVTVKLPDYIHGLCKQQGAQVQITNIKHGKVLWIEEIRVENNEFVVGMDRSWYDQNEYQFYWSFTAVRKDIEDITVEFEP
jgi:hypothetical protein